MKFFLVNFLTVAEMVGLPLIRLIKEVNLLSLLVSWLENTLNYCKKKKKNFKQTKNVRTLARR